ncbi:MAG: 3-keto-5-aminohexanoate cleavage protein [Myxococcota bacterium]
MDKLIINAAITGMVPRKADNATVPVRGDEIVAEARRVYDGGATVIHVHARDDAEDPTYERSVYEPIIQGIREACPGMIISGSTSGRKHKLFEQRSEVLGCQPDLGSLTVGSLNFPKQASINEPKMIQALATAMREAGIVPEMEFFDLGMVDYARDFLVPRGFIDGPLYCNILLGSLGTAAATPRNLVAMVDALPEGTTWSATGIGRFQFSINCLAIAMGGHVRVGLEDNLWMDEERTVAATNTSLIERVVGVAESMGRQIANAEEAREIIGLPKRPAAAERGQAGPPPPPQPGARPQPRFAH